jgi:hypothetical protein
VGKPEGKRLLGTRPRRKWEDNIKVDVREKYGMMWAGLIWLRIGSSEGFL